MAAESAQQAVEHVAQIKDAAERARLATQLLGEHQTAVTELARIRRLAVAELRDQGLSYAQVGNALGVTRGRIAQLRGPDATTEAAFFGGRTITIATPLRQEPGGRAMVAQEDADAAALLAARLTSLDLTPVTDRIPAGGAPDFSPDALVVICGPKTSPAIAEILDRDPALSFAERPDGRWTIQERATGTEHASPLSANENANVDVAYLGRLDRGDGRPFILIAGVHAIGSLGVATLLADPVRLRALERATTGHAFSIVIRSTFDPVHLSIIETEPVTSTGPHAE